MSMSTVKLVGPVMRGTDRVMSDAVIEAIELDNPGAEISVEDQGGYVRIGIAQRCLLTRASMEEALGRDHFKMSELEQSLSAFAGRMRWLSDDEVEWYLDRED
jgi:toluene monooxygenase system protein D